MAHATIQLGSTGSDVAYLRDVFSNIGIVPDASVADPNLFDAWLNTQVRAYQSLHGIKVDGIVGPDTWATLEGQPLPSNTGSSSDSQLPDPTKSGPLIIDDGGSATAAQSKSTAIMWVLGGMGLLLLWGMSSGSKRSSSSKKKKAYGDAVSEGLIHAIAREPDCDRAAKLLMQRRGLATGPLSKPSERDTFAKVAENVARRCTKEVSNAVRRLHVDPDDVPGLHLVSTDLKTLSKRKVRKAHRDASVEAEIVGRRETTGRPSNEGTDQVEWRTGRDGVRRQYRLTGGRWRLAEKAVYGKKGVGRGKSVGPGVWLERVKR